MLETHNFKTLVTASHGLQVSLLHYTYEYMPAKENPTPIVLLKYFQYSNEIINVHFIPEK